MTNGSGFVIELGGRAAGLVVRDGHRFRFYAADKTFAGLERAVYKSPAEAEHACRRLLWPRQSDNAPSLRQEKPKPRRPILKLRFGV